MGRMQDLAETPLPGGRLRPCPARPNCVCSEHPGARGHIAPIPFAGDPATAWSRLREAVRATGGVVHEESDGYLRAEFTSRVFRFVDDLELRLDTAGGVLHVRSASRVGYSDLGANRRRVERLRARFAGMK